MLKFCGAYWCYCTGFWFDGRCFGVLRSDDLVQWEEHPGALAPLEAGYPEYWAPEVSFWSGRFYMYYSCGDGVDMHVRVATADHPAGPYQDAGRRLSHQQFAIDPHVFEDDDGARYMFYATDFLAHSHIGTGTVIDRLLDPFTLAGTPRPVARARFDWQVYDPQRLEKGGVRWHTVEGPFVLKRKGRYYQMFSGGNWQNTTYGVSYATTPRIDTLEEWTQLVHDDRRPLVLRTLPGRVTGPGHNSVVRGPDNLQLFCVYHRWAGDGSGRLLSIDRLEWIGDRIAVLGPSTDPQPAPIAPGLSGFARDWEWRSGQWTAEAASARQGSAKDPGTAVLPLPFDAFVLEVTLRLEHSERCANPIAGVALCDREHAILSVTLAEAPGRAEISVAGEGRVVLPAPAGFDPGTYHLLRLEVDGSTVRVTLDGRLGWEGSQPRVVSAVRLFTDETCAAFSGFAVTAGWNDLFMGDPDPAGLPPGWTARGSVSTTPRRAEGWATAAGSLVCRGLPECGMLIKDHALEEYEVVINTRLLEMREGAALGFCPALDAESTGPCFTVEVSGHSPSLYWRNLRGRDSQLAGGPTLAAYCPPPGAEPHGVPAVSILQSGRLLNLLAGVADARPHRGPPRTYPRGVVRIPGSGGLRHGPAHRGEPG